MALFKPANEAASTLATNFGHADSPDPTLDLNDASEFPSSGGYIRIDDGNEWALYKYTGKSSNTLSGLSQSGVSSDQESISTYTFPTGSVVSLTPVADYVGDITDILNGAASYPADQNYGGKAANNIDLPDLQINAGTYSGVTDDKTVDSSTGIQNALDDALARGDGHPGGGIVRIPNGWNVGIGSRIDIPAGVILDARGAELWATADVDMVLIKPNARALIYCNTTNVAGYTSNAVLLEPTASGADYKTWSKTKFDLHLTGTSNEGTGLLLHQNDGGTGEDGVIEFIEGQVYIKGFETGIDVFSEGTASGWINGNHLQGMITEATKAIAHRGSGDLFYNTWEIDAQPISSSTYLWYDTNGQGNVWRGVFWDLGYLDAPSGEHAFSFATGVGNAHGEKVINLGGEGDGIEIDDIDNNGGDNKVWDLTPPDFSVLDENYEYMIRFSLGTTQFYINDYRDIDSGNGYQWTSSVNGTNEYYAEASGGGNPNLSAPSDVRISGSSASEGTAGSLAAGEWDYGNNDAAISFNTIYVRLSDGNAPGADEVESYVYGTPSEDYAFAIKPDKVTCTANEFSLGNGPLTGMKNYSSPAAADLSNGEVAIDNTNDRLVFKDTDGNAYYVNNDGAL